MPRLSLKTIMQRALGAAVLDRKAMADCYAEETEGRAAALAEVREVLSLKRKLAELAPRAPIPPELFDSCYHVLLWAHYWESGLADANHNKGAVAAAASAAARLYQTTRITHFGKSRLETFVDNATAVDMYDLLQGNYPGAAAPAARE